MHQNPKANSLYVKTAINTTLIQKREQLKNVCDELCGLGQRLKQCLSVFGFGQAAVLRSILEFGVEGSQ